MINGVKKCFQNDTGYCANQETSGHREMLRGRFANDQEVQSNNVINFDDYNKLMAKQMQGHAKT